MTNAKKSVLLAYSGGLDTSWLVAWLTREEGYAVTTLTVDCGGFDAAERARFEERALRFGAVEHRLVDAKTELFERVLRWLVAGNVRRGETYPLCVAAERGLQAEVLARVAREGGYDAVAHGCTGAGNDQVRFESALHVVAENVEVLAPVRDRAVTREDERAWLAAAGLEVPEHGGLYSVNAGLWGLSIGGGEMHTSEEPLPEEAWVWTREPKSAPLRLTVGFERGVPARLNGAQRDPVALIEELNRTAGKHGVGRGYHLGDTVLGIKGRIGYEAPAAEVLLTAHRELEKLVLTEEQRFWKAQLGDVYGRKLHQGQMHEPFLRDVEALFASSQERVSGEVKLVAQGGHVLVEGLSSPWSLLAASDARYGERAASDTDPRAGKWLARTLSEPARLARRVLTANGVRS